jgi:Domain of unknown function (DUF4349)
MQIHKTTGGRRPLIAWLSVMTLVLVVAACSSSGSASQGGREADPGTGDAAGFPSAAPSAASAAGAPVIGSTDGQQTGGGDAIGLVDDAKIVRTGTMVLDVTDVPKAVASARDAIRGMGGYVGASNTSNQDDQPVASVTYRIPVDRWEDALAALRSLNGLTTKIVTEETAAVEVTGQIVDLQARIRNLQASETALQAIELKAVKISDVLEVQTQLTDVRGQIEVLTAQLKDVGDRAAYATLTVQFGTPVVAVEAAKKDWDPATVVDEASATMVGVLQGLAGAGIWFAIVWLPILLVLAVVAGLGVWIVRRTGVRGRPLPPPPSAPTAPPPSAPISAT